jgi:hypothetical protein
MPIIKTPFDQNKYLSSDEPGICNALVLEWLYSNGRPLRFMRRTVTRARAVHHRGLGTAEIVQYGFKIGDGSDIYPGRNLDGIERMVQGIKSSDKKKFIIGFCGNNAAGHAIGMIKTEAGAKGFDPNNGYYDITGDDAFLWLKKKILGARIKHDYREFLVYELS